MARAAIIRQGTQFGFRAANFTKEHKLVSGLPFYAKVLNLGSGLPLHAKELNLGPGLPLYAKELNL